MNWRLLLLDVKSILIKIGIVCFAIWIVVWLFTLFGLVLIWAQISTALSYFIVVFNILFVVLLLVNFLIDIKIPISLKRYEK